VKYLKPACGSCLWPGRKKSEFLTAAAKWTALIVCCLGVAVSRPLFGQQDDCKEGVSAHILLNAGSVWRPPFGLDRVGRPFMAIVQIDAKQRPLRDYYLAGYTGGQEVERQLLHVTGPGSVWFPPYQSSLLSDMVTFKIYPTEVALVAECGFRGKSIELLREKVTPPALEADAIATPSRIINPVDLGTVLFPADWLLLEKGQRFVVDVAAISYAGDVPQAVVSGWLGSLPQDKVTVKIPIKRSQRAEVKLAFRPVSTTVRDDVLHVAIADGAGKAVWEKQIKTVVVDNPPYWPSFGATATKLSFDAPISVRDPATGAMSTMEYSKAWNRDLNDVVVSFPNGNRFVFWRGSGYVPFWASRHNTGLTYEWAETTPPPGGFNDSVEPLMDKKLKYSRVEILESTPARVHVRWTYQSTDFDYRVWGDSAAEDFYFYPDGFGTRVLHLKSAMGSNYELSEFIILAPQAAYPLEVIPHSPVELLFVDGLKREVSFPFYVEGMTKKFTWPDYLVEKAQSTPVVYRVRLNKDDRETAVYFNPQDTHLPSVPFGPFYDRGYLVTPAYWGSHWPLSRGKSTGASIDDRIYSSPSHNSLMSFARVRPKPNSTSYAEQDLDTLGQSKPMSVDTWIWLIGMTDASDEVLLDRARSFDHPPSLTLEGAKLDFNSYVPARRAIRLVVQDKTVVITFQPAVRCVDPVFELRGQQGNLVSVALAGKKLNASEYAWDGHTLWLGAEVAHEEQLRLEFGGK